MNTNTPELLKARIIASITLDELNIMEKQKWSNEDKRRFSESVGNDSTFDDELYFVERTIECYGDKSTWYPFSSIFIPRSSQINLFNDSGIIRYSPEESYVTPSGNGRVTGENFVMPTMNRLCFLVGIEDPPTTTRHNPYKVFWNQFVMPNGASIGTVDISWDISERGGQIVTAFNDNNFSDNNGVFVQKIRICQNSSFAILEKMKRNII